jgi:hypothetical protein
MFRLGLLPGRAVGVAAEESRATKSQRFADQGAVRRGFTAR